MPEGNYDRLLDVSRAMTGVLFFVPSVPLLESLADGPPSAGTGPGESPGETRVPVVPRPAGGGALEIGSLRGASQDE